MPRRVSLRGFRQKGGTVTKKKICLACFASFMFLLALGITLYPIISSSYNDRHQSEIHAAWQEQVWQVDTSAIEEARELAVAYNEAISSGVQLADRFSGDALLWASGDYNSQLNLTGSGVMGYVQVPVIGVNLPIYHGTDETTLEIGVGHLLGSSLPVGGESTHTVLTGHSGMASKKMFSDLDQLQIGDVFCLEVLGERLAYQVDQIKTVLPTDTTYLGITEGEDYCTLVTCTPFGVNTHRLLVRGTRIPYEEADDFVETAIQEDEQTASTWEQAYIKSICISIAIVALVGIIALVIWLYRRYRNEKVA